MDQTISLLREGLRRGIKHSRVVMQRVPRQVESQIVEDAEQSRFYRPFGTMPALSDTEGQRLRKAVRDTIAGCVVPSYRKLLAFVNEEYLPACYEEVGVWQMPDGENIYRHFVRKYTTTGMTPDEVFETGLQEVARIRAEMEQVKDKSGFTGSMAEFFEFLRTDPRFYAKTPQELLNHAAWISKRVDGQLGKIIGTLPRGRFTIVPVPPAIAPFWTAGRGGAGTYWVNTYDLPSRPLYNLPALTLHESAPGHALQGSLVQEQGEVPGFRKEYISAYGEGWGLYSEWLGKEMGIYETPYDDFGRLTYAMWRAARLVIDTGVHHKGWTREQALAYLRDNTALSEHEVTTEVDRYISWPGQALSYKLGEITIMRLRREAEAELGAKFDVRAFHDAILSQGSVPLPVLEAQIRAWVARAKVAKP